MHTQITLSRTELQGYMLAYLIPHSTPITPAVAMALACQAFWGLNLIYADNILIRLRKPGDSGGPAFHVAVGGSVPIGGALVNNLPSKVMQGVVEGRQRS